MFKRIRKWAGETADDAKKWKETRVNFGKSTWSTFMDYFSRIRGQKMVTETIPFDQAMIDWGFGTGERNMHRARTMVAFMCVFFYVIAAWCGFYIFRMLFFNVNIVSAVACALGLGTGVFVGTINLWRWMVIAKRRYVPFPTWIRGGMRM